MIDRLRRGNQGGGQRIQYVRLMLLLMILWAGVSLSGNISVRFTGQSRPQSIRVQSVNGIEYVDFADFNPVFKSSV